VLCVHSESATAACRVTAHYVVQRQLPWMQIKNNCLIGRARFQCKSVVGRNTIILRAGPATDGRVLNFPIKFNSLSARNSLHLFCWWRASGIAPNAQICTQQRERLMRSNLCFGPARWENANSADSVTLTQRASPLFCEWAIYSQLRKGCMPNAF
jgi:hypothetical protein